jgi:hypothetical protein
MSTPDSGQSKPINPTTKRAAVLRVFLERGNTGLNCFEAVNLAHDYVLRSTVSELVRDGISFSKRPEQVPGHGGSPVDCVRYSLTPEGAAKARALLDGAATIKAERAQSAADAERLQRAIEQERRDRARRVPA